MSEWISVKDRLPEPGIPVLVSYIDIWGERMHSDGVAAIDGRGAWGWWNGDDADETVMVEITHWMPLPEPPEEETINHGS